MSTVNFYSSTPPQPNVGDTYFDVLTQRCRTLYKDGSWWDTQELNNALQIATVLKYELGLESLK